MITLSMWVVVPASFLVGRGLTAFVEDIIEGWRY